MKNIRAILTLLIFAVSAANAAAPVPKEQPTIKKGNRKTKKLENINAAYELLKTHQFSIREYSYRDRTIYFFSENNILKCDKTDYKNTKLISEELNNNIYTLTFAGIHVGYAMNCIFKLSLDLDSGVLDIRYFNYDHNENPLTADISKQGRGNRRFIGDYTNILPLEQRQGW